MPSPPRLRRPPAATEAKRAVLGLAAVLLGACRLAPEHVRGPLPTAAEYPAELAPDPRLGVRAVELARHSFIVDPRLEALIAAALEHNRDLTVAVAQVQEARGAYRIERAARVPGLSVEADASRSLPGGGFGGGFGGGLGVPSDDERLETYSVAVAVPSFELDFWARLRNLSASARARFFATAEAEQAFRLTLLRQVADAYLSALEAAARIDLAERTVASRREEMRLAERRLEAGVISALELAQTETLLTQAETELAALRLARARSEHALTLLVGAPLGTLDLPEGAPLGEQIGTAPLTAGLPSDLLATRPDVRAAEERLRAARADIGAARAAFFPAIALTARSGYASTELGELVGAEGNTWSFGPALSVPIFDLGRRRAGVTVAEAREIGAVADYERTIQSAFQEVADALAGRRYLAEQADAQERGTLAQRRLAELARDRYREGVISYLEVLDAERTLFAAEQALLQARRAQAANLIALYVALGGGLQ